MTFFSSVRVVFSLLLIAALSTPAVVGAAGVEERIRRILSEQVPQLRVTDVRPTELDGIHEVRTNQDTLYMSADGGHAVVGTLLRFDEAQGIVNLTEQGRAAERKKKLSQLKTEDMIAFSPAAETKATLYVFTDINCGYCRKLHRNMQAMNEMGIRVNYLSFPRGGPGSEGHRKAIATWCADNPRETMTRAKRGESIPDAECDHPVNEQYQLGRAMGVSGTPAIVFEDGRMIPGFRPPEALADLLDLSS